MVDSTALLSCFTCVEKKGAVGLAVSNLLEFPFLFCDGIFLVFFCSVCVWRRLPSKQIASQRHVNWRRSCQNFDKSQHGREQHRHILPNVFVLWTPRKRTFDGTSAHFVHLALAHTSCVVVDEKVLSMQ